MPGWTTTLQTNSSLVNYNPYLNSDDIVKNTNLAFDLSSLDYNAKGAEGWGNRLIGLTSFLNPISWVSTWAGVSEANAKKRAQTGEEGNFFTQAWDNIIGVGGEALEGIFAGTNITEKLATSLLMTVGSGVEELTDLMSGHTDKDTWFDKIGKSWDLSNTSEIGSGKALIYTLGNVGKLFTGGNVDKKALVESGNGWLDNDFDIFNAEDRKQLNEGFLMGGVGGVLNFAGEILLDATSLIPGGAFVKAGHMIIRGAAKAGSKVELNLLKEAYIVEGKAAPAENMLTKTLDWLAENKNIEEIHNYLKAKGWSDDQISVAATLLHQADTRNEVIDTIITLGHGGADALASKARLIQSIVTKSNPEYSLFALDSLSDGGKLGKLMRDPKFAGKEEVLASEVSEELDTALNKLFDLAILDAPAKEAVERAAAAGVTKGKNAAGEIVDTTVTAVQREFGIATTGIGRKYIEWSSKVTSDDGFWKWIEYRPNVPWLPTLVRGIRRGSRTSAKDIRWDNTGVLFDQFKSRLADIDSITKGTFAKSGTSAGFLERFFAANTDTARRAIWEELDDYAAEAIIKKHNLIDAAGLDTAKKLLFEGFRKATTELDEGLHTGATKVNAADNTVTKLEQEGADTGTVTTAPQLASKDLAMDWYGLDKRLTSNGPVTKLKDMVKGPAETFNSLWSNVILIRPARVARERVFGTVGILLSGNFYDVFLSSNARAAYINFFHNIPTRVDRLVDRYAVKKAETGSFFGNTKKNITDKEKTVARITTTLNAVQGVSSDTLKKAKQEAASRARALDPEDRINLEEARLHAEAQAVYHATKNPEGLPELDGQNFLMTSDNIADAREYVPDDLIPIRNYEQPRQLNSEKLDSAQKKRDAAQKRKDELEKKLDEAQEAELKQKENLKTNNKDKEFDTLNLDKDKLRALELIKSGVLTTQKLASILKTLENTQGIFITETGKIVGKNKEIYDAAKNALENPNKSAEAVYQKLDAKLTKVNEEIDALDSELNLLKQDELSDINHPQRQAVLDELDEDESIYMLTPDGSWKEISRQHFDNLTPEQLDYSLFKIGPANAALTKTVKVDVAGKSIDIDNDEIPEELWKSAKFKSEEEFRIWYKSGDASRNSCGRAPDVIAAMTNLGVGVIRFTDNLGNKVNAVNPGLADTGSQETFKNVAQQRVANGTDDLADAINNPQNYDFDLKNKESLTELDLKAKEILDTINGFNGNTANALEYVKNSKDEIQKLITAKSELNRSIVSLKKSLEPTNAGLKTRSTGKIIYGVHAYDNFAEGRDGQYAAAIASPADTWNRIHNMDRTANAVHGNRGRASVPPLASDNPKYFDGLAGWLQVYGRGDEVVALLASGKTPAEVIDWLRSTKAGKIYAERMKIGTKYTKADEIAKLEDEASTGYHTSYEDFVNLRATIVNEQIFTPELKELFNSDTEITGALLREILGDKDNLPIIAGRLINPNAERRVLTYVGDWFRKINKLLVEKPQEVLENFPLATELYNKKMQELIDINFAEKGRQLKIEEINSLQDIARKSAIKEMQKWMYNVQKKTNFEDAVGLFVPFITAYTFTVKMFMRSLREQPEKALWAMAGINNTIGQLNWVDQNGEPTNMLQASALVIPIDENVRKIMKDVWFVGDWFENAKELSLSAKSLNVFFGGEIIPGPGPLISVPVSELVKANPILAAQINKATQEALPFIPGGEGLVDYLLPMGPSAKPLSYDQLLPTWINQGLDANAIGRWFGSDYRGVQYLDAMGKVAAYESAKARMLGPDEPLPTEEEILAKVDALYNLKFVSAFISPFSFQVKTEADLAKREYMKYKEVWGESADWMFLTQKPELVGAVASATKNPYGLAPDIETAKNLESNPEIVNIFMNAGDAGKDMLGFFMNSSNNPQYDDYAYTYLTEKGAGVGEESYYSKLSTSERSRKAAAAAGWIAFNKLVSTIDAELIDTNTTIDTNTRLATYKSTGIAELRKKYPEWAAEYSKQDAYKFAERTAVLEQLLTNEKFVSQFGNKAEVKAIAVFVSQRNNIMNMLQERKALGYSGTIGAKSNQDIAAIYNQIIAQLKTESVRFSDFYNRYFDGDSLVF